MRRLDLRYGANIVTTGSLDLKETDLAVSAKDGDIKALWERLQSYMPCYSLFQADKKNTDNDDEIQDPLKTAVKQILSDPALLQSLDEVATKVREKLQNVSNLTLKKIKEMNPEIATAFILKFHLCKNLNGPMSLEDYQSREMKIFQ